MTVKTTIAQRMMTAFALTLIPLSGIAGPSLAHANSHNHPSQSASTHVANQAAHSNVNIARKTAQNNTTVAHKNAAHKAGSRWAHIRHHINH